MNFASWVILGIVVLAVVLAVRAVFSKKNRKGSCCEVGDNPPTCPPSACETCGMCQRRE